MTRIILALLFLFAGPAGAVELPPGTVLASANRDPAMNTSPGVINHLAIVVSATDVIEDQGGIVENGKGKGVIRTPLADYMKRDYMPIIAYQPLDLEAGKRAAANAEKLVGLPHRNLSSIARRHGERRQKRGLNCVAVVEVAWAEASKIGRLKIPDDISKVKDTFKPPQTIR